MPRLLFIFLVLWAFMGSSLASQRQQSSENSQESSQDLLESPRSRSIRRLRLRDRTMHFNAQTLMTAPAPADSTNEAEHNPLTMPILLPPRIPRPRSHFEIETQLEEEIAVSETHTLVGSDESEDDERVEEAAVTGSANQQQAADEEYFFEEFPNNQEYFERMQEERELRPGLSLQAVNHGLYRTLEISEPVLSFKNFLTPLKVYNVEPSDEVLMSRIKKRIYLKPRHGTWGRYTDPESLQTVYFAFPFKEDVVESGPASQDSCSFNILDYMGIGPSQPQTTAQAAPEPPMTPRVPITRSSYRSPSQSRKREAPDVPPPIKRTRLDSTTDVVAYFSVNVPVLREKAKSRLLRYMPHLNDLLSDDHESELTEKMVYAFEFRFEKVFFPAVELFSKDTTLLLQGCLLAILEDVDFEKFHRLRSKFSFSSEVVSQSFEHRFVNYIMKMQQTSPSAADYLLSCVNAPFLFNHLCSNDRNWRVGKFCLDVALKAQHRRPISPNNMIQQGVVHALKDFKWHDFSDTKKLEFYSRHSVYLSSLFDTQEEFFSYMQGLMWAVKSKFTVSSSAMQCICDDLINNNLVMPFVKHEIRMNNYNMIKLIYSLITAEMTELCTMVAPRTVRFRVINDNLVQLIIEGQPKTPSPHARIVVLPRYQE